mmetsp:Transcript_1900/g.1942  ORF Transcript_1900/g.1942 Transcript_1900/m.1942 type:complete len:495 (+) Transcript_1900:3-1487(+)
MISDECKTFLKVLAWVSNILLILGWVLLIIGFAGGGDSEHGLYTAGFVIIMIFYAVYICLQTLSNTFFYLLNVGNSQSIHTYMDKVFSNPVKITFFVETYHYETRRTKHGTTRVRVTTNSANKDFQYKHCRDKSGAFNLDLSEKSNNSSIHFIKLNLSHTYTFWDVQTKRDFEAQKDSFYYQYRNKDSSCDIWHKYQIEGVDSHALVKLDDSYNMFIGFHWFIVFGLILPFAQFYKLYIAYKCSSQEFTIKKCVSSYTDLYTGEAERKLAEDAPKVVQAGKDLFLFKKKTSHFNEQYQPDEKNQEFRVEVPIGDNRQLDNNHLGGIELKNYQFNDVFKFVDRANINNKVDAPGGDIIVTPKNNNDNNSHRLNLPGENEVIKEKENPYDTPERNDGFARYDGGNMNYPNTNNNNNNRNDNVIEVSPQKNNNQERLDVPYNTNENFNNNFDSGEGKRESPNQNKEENFNMNFEEQGKDSNFNKNFVMKNDNNYKFK